MGQSTDDLRIFEAVKELFADPDMIDSLRTLFGKQGNESKPIFSYEEEAEQTHNTATPTESSQHANSLNE